MQPLKYSRTFEKIDNTACIVKHVGERNENYCLLENSYVARSNDVK